MNIRTDLHNFITIDLNNNSYECLESIFKGTPFEYGQDFFGSDPEITGDIEQIVFYLQIVFRRFIEHNIKCKDVVPFTTMIGEHSHYCGTILLSTTTKAIITTSVFPDVDNPEYSTYTKRYNF